MRCILSPFGRWIPVYIWVKYFLVLWRSSVIVSFDRFILCLVEVSFSSCFDSFNVTSLVHASLFDKMVIILWSVICHKYITDWSAYYSGIAWSQTPDTHLPSLSYMKWCGSLILFGLGFSSWREKPLLLFQILYIHLFWFVLFYFCASLCILIVDITSYL